MRPQSTRSPNTTCAHCGAPFFAWPYKLKAGEGRFCSVPCRQAFMRGPDSPCRRLLTHGHAGYSRGCRCIVCVDAKRASDHSYYERHRDAIGQATRAYTKSHPDMQARAQNTYRQAHLEVYRRAQQDYKNRFPERVRATVRRYRAKPMSQEAMSQSRRLWYVANRTHALAYARADTQTERGRLVKIATDHRRRARQQAAPGWTSTTQLAGRIALYGGLCWICHVPATTIDHVIPLARGGSNWPANLRPACRGCNSSKGARWWPQRQRIPGQRTPSTPST